MRSRDREKNPKGKVKEKGSIKMTKNIKNIAAATISLALAASLAPTAAFAADASELPIAVSMAAQPTTTQASINTSSAFADTLHTLIADEAAKVYAAQAQAQGLDADAAIAQVYNA